jgi:dihydrofolate reductase
MAKLIAFENVSVDGYFTDPKGDMSWAHSNDPEWNEFTSQNAGGGGRLLLGRITYDLMVSFWPTEQARQMMPDVADAMNNMPKVVFSRSMDHPSWNNTTLIKDDIGGAVRKLKEEPGDDLVILGSGSIVAQLTKEGLIDEYQIIAHPLVLGKGRTLFEDVDKLNLKRTKTRTFENGNVLSCYEPA